MVRSMEIEEAYARQKEVQYAINNIPFLPQIDFLVRTVDEEGLDIQVNGREVRAYTSHRLRIGLLIDVPLALKQENVGYIPGMLVIYDDDLAVDYQWFNYPDPTPPTPAGEYITDSNIGECVFDEIKANEFIQVGDDIPTPPMPSGQMPMTYENFSTAVFDMLIARRFQSTDEQPAGPTTFEGTPFYYDQTQNTLFQTITARKFTPVSDDPHPPTAKEIESKEDDAFQPSLKLVRPGGIVCREAEIQPLVYLYQSQGPAHARPEDDEEIEQKKKKNRREWKTEYYYSFN